MSDCNGFKLRALNQDCNRVAVKSSVATTWMMTYKDRVLSMPKEFDVAMDKNEIVVLKCEDGAGHAAIEIRPLGDNVGTIIAQSSRKGIKTLRVGEKYRFELDPGESLVIRGSRIIHPTNSGAGLPV